MAGKGYTVGIASETKAFKQGVQAGIIDPLEDARKELDDLGRSSGPRQLEQQVGNAEDALRDLGNSTAPHKLEQQMRGAQQETKDLATETKRTADAIEREYKAAYRSAKQNADDGLDRMKDRSAEVGGEIRQNLGEGIANAARGDFESLADTIGDTLGGAVAGIGGIGTAAVGVAGALGLGAILAAFQNIQAAEEEAKQAAGEWADIYIQEGSRALSASTIIANGLDILKTKYDEVKTNAQLWGVERETAAAAMAGSQTAIDEVTDSIDRQGDAYQRAVDKAGGLVDEFGNLNGPLAQQGKHYEDAKAALSKLTGAMDTGSQQADVYAYFLRDLADKTEGATRVVDEFGDTVVTLPDGKKIYIDAETKQATDNVDAIDQKIYGLSGKTVPITADTSQIDAEIRRLRQTNIRINGQIVYQTPGGSKLY